MLDLLSFNRAIFQMEEAVEFCQSDLAKNDSRLFLHLRAGAIQAFEFTYELAIKMLRRFLEATEPNPAVSNEMTFNELIRLGYERGLLESELVTWKEFRKNRGTTSHTYDEEKASDVYDSIPNFLNEVKFLYSEIQRRQSASK